MSADVAKLGGDAEEELVLASYGFVNVAGQAGALFGLQCLEGKLMSACLYYQKEENRYRKALKDCWTHHISVRDFRNGREEKNDC